MAILTRDQIEKLAEIIRKHATWVVWRLLGDKYVFQKDIDKLTQEGTLPMGVQTPVIQHSFVLGRMESLLKEAEWKGFTWDQLVDAATAKHTDLQKLQIEATELSANVTLRGLFDDIQRGLYQEIAQATGQAVTEAVVKEKVAEEIKDGVESRKGYIKVANGLVDSLKETQRNWHRVAVTEMHSAKEKGVVSSILSGEGVYRRADGPESFVAVMCDPDACQDCRRLYLDPTTGHPKIFLLSELLSNEGTNYIRPWRQNARPVIPPLHPHCFCRLRYVPPGWGWNDKGRFTVVDSDRYSEHLQSKVDKSVGILSKADDGDHSLLRTSQQQIPSQEEIDSIQTRQEAVQLAESLDKIKELYADDPEEFKRIEGIQHNVYSKAVDFEGQEAPDVNS
jgi:hypothetical protein